MDTTGWMLANALQDIDPIVVGVDRVQPTGHDQALEDADVPGAEFCPAEQPIATPHRNRPQSTFEMLGVDRHVRVDEKHLQPASLVTGKASALVSGLLGSNPCAAKRSPIQVKTHSTTAFACSRR